MNPFDPARTRRELLRWYLLLAIYYYALIKTLSALSRWLERRMPVL